MYHNDAQEWHLKQNHLLCTPTTSIWIELINILSTMHFCKKTIKCWQKLFSGWFEMFVIDSYILHNSILCPRKPNYLAYRRTIVESYASRYISTAPPHQWLGHPRKSQTPDQSDLEGLNHQLHLLDKSLSLHDCVVCSNRSVKRHRTPYFCKTCSNTPYLCPHSCFEHYHMLRRYRL